MTTEAINESLIAAILAIHDELKRLNDRLDLCHVEPMTRTCEGCNCQFVPNRKDQRYHSSMCQMASHARRTRAAARATKQVSS